MLMPMLSACGGSDDEPDGVYDWDVNKQTYAVRKQGNSTSYEKIDASSEVVKSKTEDQMKILKLEYESKSNDWYKYRYYYHKK